MKANIRRSRHCVFIMHAHLVFVTKYRHTIFTKSHLEHMQRIFNKICHDFQATLTEFNGEQDHVHLLISYHPKMSVSKLVNSLKGVSSRMLRQSHPDILEYYWKGVLWSPSYFASSCGGASISIVRQYIEQQKTPK